MEQETLQSAQAIAEAFYDEHYIFFWLIGTCVSICAAAVPTILIPMWIRSSRLLGLCVSIHKTTGQLKVVLDHPDDNDFGSTMTNVGLRELRTCTQENTKVLELVAANLATSNSTLKSLSGLIEKERERRVRQDEWDEQLRKIKETADDKG